MCYSEFNDVLQVIERMDADVISIENARSGSELLQGFEQYKYPNEIGPGVYDIPFAARAVDGGDHRRLVVDMTRVLDGAQIWVNPDCGLKTAWAGRRRWLRSRTWSTAARRDEEWQRLTSGSPPNRSTTSAASSS